MYSRRYEHRINTTKLMTYLLIVLNGLLLMKVYIFPMENPTSNIEYSYFHTTYNIFSIINNVIVTKHQYDSIVKHYSLCDKVDNQSDHCPLVLSLYNDVCNTMHNQGSYILSFYGVFSDRVGLPLHNIPSPFLSVMGYLFSRSQVLPYPFLHSLTMSFLVFQLAFCLQLQTPYISSHNHPHLSSAHVHTIPVYYL